MESVGKEGLIVVIGTPTPDSSKLYAITVTEGDPTWAGPLAGEALGLPVYHITEAEIRDQVDADLFDEELGGVDMVLDVDDIASAIREVRDRVGVS